MRIIAATSHRWTTNEATCCLSKMWWLLGQATVTWRCRFTSSTTTYTSSHSGLVRVNHLQSVELLLEQHLSCSHLLLMISSSTFTITVVAALPHSRLAYGLRMGLTTYCTCCSRSLWQGITRRHERLLHRGGGGGGHHATNIVAFLFTRRFHSFSLRVG